MHGEQRAVARSESRRIRYDLGSGKLTVTLCVLASKRCASKAKGIYNQSCKCHSIQ
jgi:hypothetical protein